MAIIKQWQKPTEKAPWVGKNILANVKDRQRKAQAVNSKSK